MIKQLSTKVVYRNPWMIVREDEAKAYHGVTWGLLTVVISLGIMAGLFIALFWIGI